MKNLMIGSGQFGALWASYEEFHTPIPLFLDQCASTIDEHERVAAQVRGAFAGDEREREHVRDAVRILAQPQVYVEISGVREDGSSICVLGALSGNWAAIAVQRPVPAAGDVALRVCDARQLGYLRVGTLPHNAAGTVVFAGRDELDPDRVAGSIMVNVSGRASKPRFEDAVSRALAGQGMVRVYAGSRDRPELVGWLRWFDIAGVGRYCVSSRREDAAVPLGPEQFVGAMNAEIAAAISIVHSEDEYEGAWR